MNFHLIISVDYEVFGNGTGCIKGCVIHPAEKMMRVAESFGAPITFFVEALEFIAMENHKVEGIEQIRQQLSHAHTRLHDTQLHLHPQWGSAILPTETAWRLDLKRWRIGDLPYHDTLRLITTGKAWLEALIREVIPSYQCLVFRAGGWCIQPSIETNRALRLLDFQIDSSVAPGLWNLTSGKWLDFRNTPQKPYWRSENDICKHTGTGLWEAPIITGNISKGSHINAIKLARVHNRGFASGCHGSYLAPNTKLQGIQEKMVKLSQLGHVMLDISTMPADILINITRQWINRFSEDEVSIPLVAIAHTKNFTPASLNNMKEYLKWAKNEGLILSTYGQWLQTVNG